MKIDLRTIPDAEVSGIDLMDVDITLPAPEAEPQRQYYFMALLKQQLVPERAKKNGKEFLTACITTFGCQMNARDSEKLEGILETVGYHIVETEDADLSFTIPVPSVKTPIFASTAVSDSLVNTKRKIRA